MKIVLMESISNLKVKGVSSTFAYIYVYIISNMLIANVDGKLYNVSVFDDINDRVQQIPCQNVFSM